MLLLDREPDQKLMERCLPAHLMYLTAYDLLRKGWILREDTRRNLNVAAAAPLVDTHQIQQRRVAKKVDGVATSMLRWLNPDSTDGLFTTALFTLKLVDEGLLDDGGNQAVLVSLVLVNDAREEGAEWMVNEAKLAVKARDLIRQAQLAGLYCRAKLPVLIKA